MMFEPINVELLKKQRDALNETIKELESGKYEAWRTYGTDVVQRWR